MTAAAFTIALVILAAPPAGSIAGLSIAAPIVGRISNPSEQDIATLVGRIGNPSYMADTIAFRGDFGPEGDRNHNGWPDDWRRRVGPGFPRYVMMSLATDASAPGGHSLRVDLNGAAATAFSPTIEVSPAHVYTVTVAVKTEKLRHDQAYVSLRLLDADEKLLSEQISARVTGDTAWRLLRLGPVASDDARVRFAVVGLHVQPGEPADLTGSVSFADVRVLRQPRLKVTTHRPFNIFADNEQVTITCQASGLPTSAGGRPLRLSLDLTNVADRARSDVSGESEQPVVKDWELPSGTDIAPSQPQPLTWSLRLPGAGYYRLRARLVVEQTDQPIANSPGDGRHYVGRIVNPSETPERVLAEHETTLAILPRVKRPLSGSRGTFGWSLPRLEEAIPPTQFATLVERLGVSIIKLPLWDDHEHRDAKEHAQPAALPSLLDALRSREVRVVGVLADPPAEVRKALFGDPAADASAASLLAVPAAKLQPQLEAAMMPLALHVRDWQLGNDTDHSLAGSRPMGEAIRTIRDGLAKDGLPVRLALPRALACRATPPGGASDGRETRGERKSSSSLLWGEGRGEGLRTCFIPSTISPADIDVAFGADPSATQPGWLTIESPPADNVTPEQRAADFAQRLVIAAASGAGAVFMHDPFERSHGLLTADGAPGDLLLPWCTVAGQLSGAKRLGRLQLPGGSENSVWERDGHVAIVLWSREPLTEPLFVGRDARQLDLWGRVASLPSRPEQWISVGPAPVFIVGADPAAARMQLAVAVQPARLASIPSMPLQISVRVPNCFGSPVAGKVTLQLPERWRVTSAKTVPIDLPADGEATVPFQIRLPLDGTSGAQRVRLDFEISGDPALRFTVYREVVVGGGDVEFSATARLDERGNLMVRQQLMNRGTTALSFTCQLSIPGRRPQRITLRRLSPGTHEHVYTVPDGRDLASKTLRLRADEIGGQRVLSQGADPVALNARALRSLR